MKQLSQNFLDFKNKIFFQDSWQVNNLNQNFLTKHRKYLL